MLSIFILIGAYRYYAQLAGRFGKTKWHYGILAIWIYLGSQVILSLSYGFYLGATNPELLRNVNYTGFTAVNIVSWLISIGVVYGVYHILEKKFKKEMIQKPSVEIDQIGSASENQQK